jgi:hypothetical protein
MLFWETAAWNGFSPAAICGIVQAHSEGTAMLHRFLAFAVVALLLAGCEAGLSFGGLPSNEACRSAEALPGHPINSDCLDSLIR